MLKRWLMYGAVAATVAVVSGTIVHNASRYFRGRVRHDRAPMQIVMHTEAAPQPAAPHNGQEESEALELIDLSVLPKQTDEPPLAGFDVPRDLPRLVDPPCPPLVQTSEPEVADFKPFSADGPEPQTKPKSGFLNFWRRMAERLWGAHDGSEESEALPTMPRAAQSADCPHQGCPYDGSQYRKSNKPALTGEEEQSRPMALPGNLIPKPNDKHKFPKVDTMEIRPGDIPWAWAVRPF